jgi:NADH-quinone oxidoreductase subunit A|uniref:NADH-ubiquinone oxidoreductase chain 3 n=1 Tax=Naegleria gruberi TaxID=5762 RepID=Q9G8P1_NAEGR|nr:NADH dehydrogenase subunit 3 [Naegleria gruberi]AAG17813.1 NADH dehydrogenase subunit 3 [Naegleria gruberi]
MYFLTEYYEYYFYGVLILAISFIILLLCYIITFKNPYTEKNYGYECGFDPFSDARNPFHVKFYLISIIFIIFDVEVAFFFPWAISIKELMFFGYYTMYLFIFILLVGFVYEWKKGALEWE